MQATPEQITTVKTLVDAGVTVYAGSDAYTVIKGTNGQYLIKCHINGHCVGLHGMAGTDKENHVNMSPIYINENCQTRKAIIGQL